MLVSELEDAVARRDRFAALHYNPGTALVDVVGGQRTTPETLDVLCRYAKSLALIPLQMKKEKRGYISNSLFGALNEPAMLLHTEWGQSIEAVDSAWMIGRGAMIGPFGVFDFIGLNVIYDGSNMSAELDDDKKDIVPIFLDELHPYIERGELGIKTGRGFYTYPETAYFQNGFLDNRDHAQELYNVMLVNVIATAILLVADGYASFERVDRVWMITQNQDIGPFGLLDEMGIDTYLKILQTDPLMTQYLKENVGRIGRFLQANIERSDLGVESGKGFYNYPEPLFRQAGFFQAE